MFARIQSASSLARRDSTSKGSVVASKQTRSYPSHSGGASHMALGRLWESLLPHLFYKGKLAFLIYLEVHSVTVCAGILAKSSPHLGKLMQ